MTMQTISIPLGSLVLLSGPPGCGKSTACQSVPQSWVVSSDALRQQFFGTAKVVVDGTVALSPMAVDDGLVFSIMEQVVRSRLKVGLTTVVDATLISDKQRAPFGAIADELNVPVQVVMFDLPSEQLQKQNKDRTCPVPDAVRKDFANRFQRTSKWPFTLVANQCELVPVIPTIPDPIEIDVIGDVHGLADGLGQLIDSLGYGADFSHPDGRKLCFLGDLVDRGTQSLEVLDMVMEAIAHGHYCALGNHDMNLLRGLQGELIKSRSTRVTLHNLFQHDQAYQDRVKGFILSRPSFYRYRNYVLCHADIDWFDPLEQPARERVYGKRKLYSSYDTDAQFCQTSAYTLVRGHIPLTASLNAKDLPSKKVLSENVSSETVPSETVELETLPSETAQDSQPSRVFSLEEGAGFGGPIVAMRLPSNQKVRQPCSFDYRQTPTTFAAQMKDLIKQKLVKQVPSPCQRLKLYKYTSKAFFSKDAWTKYPELKLARGVVVGLHGNPVSRPFPRTFNYLEQNTTLPLNTPITAIEKLNGFLVTLFRHPYQQNEVVVSCSGSFKGEYVELARSLLYRNGLYGRVLTYLRQNPTITLLWEAIHPNDPHIIPYAEDQHGLHLIGAGDVSVDDATGGFLSETDLDEVANTLEVPRPSWWACEFGEAIASVRTVDHEGFMIRLQDGTFALKLKSPYYLRTKFLARMTEKKSKFMFKNPERFKQDIDEELWPLVDGIVTQISESDWLTWSDVVRRDWVQAWMDTHMFSGEVVNAIA
ncbi:MAG: AAA family ATPase [Cyanobacteria bacterium P01_F01_bin.150]